MTQLSLLASDFGNAIKIRTHHRREDGETSREAARRVVPKLTEQQERAVALVRRFGPGTTWEIAARFCTEYGAWPSSHESISATHYLLARRLPEEPEITGAVTCGRIRDSEGKTIKQDVKVCSVRGTRQAIWRIA